MAGVGQALQAGGPVGFKGLSELVEDVPGVQARIVSVVEHDLDRVIAHRFAADDLHGLFADHGFDWRTCNTGAETTRLPPWAARDQPLKALDWLFVRGVGAGSPAVIPALSEAGAYLSDHELIMTRVTL